MSGLAELERAFTDASGRVHRFATDGEFAVWIAAEATRTGATLLFVDPGLPEPPPGAGVRRVTVEAAAALRPADSLMAVLAPDCLLGRRPVPGVADAFPGRRRLLHLARTLVLAVRASAPPPPLDAARLAALGDVTFVAGPSRTADIEKTIVLGAHGPVTATLALLP